jgi:hypothetical protein
LRRGGDLSDDGDHCSRAGAAAVAALHLQAFSAALRRPPSRRLWYR